jgi:hypothetical protein
MLNSCSPVTLVAASRVIVTAAPDNNSFYRMLGICIPEATVRMCTRIIDDPVIAAGADALLAMGQRGRLVSIQLLNFNLVHQMADALGQVREKNTAYVTRIPYPSALHHVTCLLQVSHWGSKIAICRALTTLCADVAFAQSLFRSTGLATTISVIRSVSTTSSHNSYPHNSYPSAGVGFGAPSSPSKTVKQTPSLTGSGRVLGEVEQSRAANGAACTSWSHAF